MKKTYEHVNDLWDDAKASQLDAVGRLDQRIGSLAKFGIAYILR